MKRVQVIVPFMLKNRIVAVVVRGNRCGYQLFTDILHKTVSHASDEEIHINSAKGDVNCSALVMTAANS